MIFLRKRDVFLIFCIFFLFCWNEIVFIHGKKKHESWVDPDTPKKFHQHNIPSGAYSFFENGRVKTYDLIFSDEFNKSKRNFQPGADRRWVALDHLDQSNLGQHYFSSQAVQTDKGSLIITTSKPKKTFKGGKYVSGSVQSWNKFCFTSGFIEMKAILPGKWGIPGTWPALWLMGNLGRAAYLKSQEGTWPWSFNTCAPLTEKVQNKHQLINACNNRTIKSNPDSLPEQYGLKPHMGRGATEIDVFEAQIQRRGAPAEITTSLQISPALDSSMRPEIGASPGPNQWYQNLTFGKFTHINKAYYGEKGLDSISALTQLHPNAFQDFHLYQLDWSPGPGGYLRWWLDGLFLFEIPESSLNQWIHGVPPRQIPQEPSYIIISTAVSEKFSPPCSGEICDSIWPSNFTIDYIRVYQDKNHPMASIGCDLPEFPTTKWIQQHPVNYGLPWYILFPLDQLFLYILGFFLLCCSLLIALKGYIYIKLCSFVVGFGLFTTSFHLLFLLSDIISHSIIHYMISFLLGLLFGSLSMFIPLISTCTYTMFLISLPCLLSFNLWIARILVFLFIIMGFIISYSYSLSHELIVITSSIISVFGILLSISLLFPFHMIIEYVYECFMILFFNKRNLIDINYWSLLFIYMIWILFACIGMYCQWRSKDYQSYIKSLSSSSLLFHDMVMSSSYKISSPMNIKSQTNFNYFSSSNLPNFLKSFSSTFKIGYEVKNQFGFQEDNVRNQIEHLI